MDKLNCILIDDKLEALERLETLLANFDFINILSKINCAEEAINIVVNLKPSLVFINVEMPKKTGFDIIKEVREQNVNPKFIIVTKYSQYAIKAIRVAAFDFLVKPVDISELRDALNRFYKNHIGKEGNSMPKSFIEKYNFSEREVEIIDFLIVGKSSQQIADELSISKYTVDSHRKHILGKTKFHSTAELVGFVSSKLN